MEKKKARKSNRNNRKFYIILVLLLLVGVSVGYAILSKTVIINGTTKIKTNQWSIYVDSVANVSATGHTKVNSSPVVPSGSTNTTTLEYNVELQVPGDTYSFDFTVKNGGTIDTVLEKLPTLSGLTTEQQKYVTHTITNKDGSAITLADSKIAAGESKTYTINVAYNEASSNTDLPTETISTVLKVALDYVQN